jgi:hypothetical protein
MPRYLLNGFSGRSAARLTTMRVQKSTSSFALCVRDDGSEDLEQRSSIRFCPIAQPLARAIFLYPSDLFVPLRLPAAIARELWDNYKQGKTREK